MQEFTRFLEKSPTPYHAVQEIASRLKKEGFIALSEEEKWDLKAGKSYFVTREDSLCIAFRLPKKTPHKAILLASHVDSPALRIKPRPELFTQGMGELLTESYGAPILHTWFDRDLAIAGRVIDKNGKSRLVHLDEHPVIIPSVAIHLNRDVNEKGLQINKQDHLRAIFSLSDKAKLFKEAPLSFDLLLTPIEKPAFIGQKQEMLAAYRLDNLTSVYASLQALIHAKEQTATIPIALFWDHEEIGSKTHTGADSFFANQILERIAIYLDFGREDYWRLKSRSLCLSIDVCHALHPNFQDKYDLQNATIMGKGPVVKFSPRYATTGATAAAIAQLSKNKKIPLQMGAGRSDLSSGGTVGPIMGANLGIPTVDLGIGCWGMHSIRETIALSDQKALYELLKASYESL
jgi:aspartyl aminopeptidase